MANSNFSATSLKVMLVDDHSVVRAGYRFLLENVDGIEVVAEASDGKDSIVLFAEHHPDVVVMDLSMPGIGGLEAIQRIRAKDPKAKILVFTMHENPAFIERALQAGVLGYISKNSSPEVLVDAIRKVATGSTYLDSGIPGIESTQHLRDSDARFSSLSPREFQILCMFADATSVEEIAEQLSLSSKTIANYLTQIKDKLGVSGSAELVHLALSKGLITL